MKLKIKNNCFQCHTLNPEARQSYKCACRTSCPGLILAKEEQEKLLSMHKSLARYTTNTFIQDLESKYNKPKTTKNPVIATTKVLKGTTICDLCGEQHTAVWTIKPAKDEMTTAICEDCLMRALKEVVKAGKGWKKKDTTQEKEIWGKNKQTTSKKERSGYYRG